MNWLISTFSSSVGKKLMMAVTGLCFMGFLTVHLIGNLTIYGGGDAFNAYAAKLHSFGAILVFFNAGLVFFAAVHILTGVLLFIQNLKARPTRYKVDNSAGGRTLSSVTMPYTGLLVLGFVIYHLINFTFVNKTGTTIFAIVSSSFGSPLTVLIYIAAMIIVALHVRHGFWSAAQTLGANHPKYMPAIMALSIIFSLVVGFGFGLLPIYISFFA